MPKICVLLLTLFISAFGQTSGDLSAKYAHVTAYSVRPNVLMTARFAADGQVCEMTLEKRQKTNTGIVFGSTFSEQEVLSLMDELVPENERGRNLTPALNGTVTGGFMTEEYTYENVLFHVDGITRPEGAAGNRVITITWRKRPCSEAPSAAR
jgi:hypothetical protein